MKLTNKYWYNHTETNVKTSPNRLPIMRPMGLFLIDGKPLPRAGNDPGICRLLLEVDSKASEKGALTTPISISPTLKYRPENHFNRMKTPRNEAEEFLEREERKHRVKQFKKIYFDDNYIRHPANKLKSIGIILPAKASMDSFQSMFNQKVSPEK